MNRRAAWLAVSWTAALCACRMSESERKAVLETAGRSNYAVARGDVVRDLRAPDDTGRLIYEPPVSLVRPSATETGAREVWAPFGIAQPDTVRGPTAR